MLRKTRRAYPPWSVSGGPDPSVSDDERCRHCRSLTAADLLGSYRRRYPDDEHLEYDRVIRRMGHVWDCPHDGAANVAGYLCASCACPEPEALAHRHRVAYVGNLCGAFARGGVDALLPLVPEDVEWVPQVAGGRVLHGSEELRAFIGHHAMSPAPRPARTEAVGDHVLVRFRPTKVQAHPVWSVYQFDDGRLVRAVSFHSEAEAIRATA